MSEIKKVKLYAVLVALLNDGYTLEELEKGIKEVENLKVLSRYSRYRNILLNLADCDLALLDKVKEIMSKNILGEELYHRGKRISYEYVVLRLVLNFLEREKKDSTDR